MTMTNKTGLIDLGKFFGDVAKEAGFKEYGRGKEAEIPLTVYHCVPKGVYFTNKNGCDGCKGLENSETLSIPAHIVERDAEDSYILKTKGIMLSKKVNCNERKLF